MLEDSLPPDVARFLAQRIATVEELEILLTLVKDPQKAWTAEEIYHVIQSSRKSVAQGLQKFVDAGLATTSQETFSMSRLPSDSVLLSLARIYQQMPVRVIQAIYQPSRDAAQDFADAFKLRRDP